MTPPRPTPLTQQRLRVLQEQFVANPEGTDLSELRPVIARSWVRSLRCDVRRDSKVFDQIREPQVDEQMLACAEPVLDHLETMAADTGASIYLADANGTIALFRGDADVQRRVDRQMALRGGAMAEDVVGTNSDGTALEEGRAVHVWGAEHFCVALQNTCCTSVPILDPLRRSVRAVLSLSLPDAIGGELDPRSIAVIAQGAASEIGQMLSSRLAVREQALLSSYLTEVRKRGADSVVVMDDRTTIASKGALNLLGDSDYAVLAGYARESERAAAVLDREVTIAAGATLHVQARPITSGGETIGSVIRLRPPKARRVRTSRVAPTNRRTDSFDTLVGESLALRRALEVATTAVRRRMPTYILGERGTGKKTLAQAMAAQLAEEVIVIGGTAAADSVACDARSALSRGAAVVVAHVDAIADPDRAELAAVFSEFDCPPVVLTTSMLNDEILELITALGGIEIEMPALRNRRDDIPLLVAKFLADGVHGVERVAPPLMRALAEADWSGNVTQLKEWVDTAAARCPYAELGTQSLSDAHQKTIARSRLSRLEEAELHQIREALAEAKGNRLRAAELLQIGRSTLYRKIETYTRRGFLLEV
jgi:transcriptional regulator of acetoin/glycerol metabolism